MRHVLIVEDDPDITQSIRDTLEDEGFEVSTARHGKEAIELLRVIATPCLILVDLLMPVMDGVEFIEALKQQGHYVASIPVIVLSASSTVSPPDGIPMLRKPVLLEEFLCEVNKLCGATPEEAG